jgi:microcystin-dependent protein
MADYNKATNFTAKDSLPTGNAGKIVKGTEIDTEFTAIASAIASKADINSPSFTGTPTSPTATAGSNTTQLANTSFVTAALAALIPTGVITLWSGSIATIPTGWLLCNGSSGTPDLRDRFVVGAGTTYAVGATGGANTVTLDATMIPSHTHSISASGTTGGQSANHSHSGTTNGMDSNNTHSHGVSDPTHSHGPGNGDAIMNHVSVTGPWFTGSGTDNQYSLSGTTAAASTGISINTVDINHGHTFGTGGVSADHNHSVTVTGTSGALGGGLAHENRPPYYALAYIMKS